MIEVVHIDGYNPVTETVETLRFTSSEDFIANGHSYMPAIAETLDFSAALFDRGTTEGNISVGVGTLTLNNLNGELDYLSKYGFDGRVISIYKPKDKDDTVTDDSNLFFTGVISYAQPTMSQIVFYVKSRMEVLNVPMQPNGFLGTNLGTGGAGGFEGSEQLSGKTKPQIFGRCMSVEGSPINEFFLMYGFNYNRDGAFTALYQVYAVYVKGVRYIYTGVDYSSAEDLRVADLTAFGPGYYATCLAAGVIRLTSTPANNGTVVADVANVRDSAATAAQVARSILELNAGMVAGVDFHAGELDALDNINTCPVGICIQNNTTIADGLNQILDSIGAWFIPDASGLFRFGWIDKPDMLVDLGAVPCCTITRDQWADNIERSPVQDKSENIPAYSVEVKHTKNWSVQDSGSLADSVGFYTREFLSNEYRSARAISEHTRLGHPLAPSLVYETLLNSKLRLNMLNGDFSIDIMSADNGWTRSGTLPTYAQSNGVLTLTPGSNIARVEQTLTYNDEAFPGTIEIGFTVPAGATLTYDVARNSGFVNIVTETIAPSASDQYIVRTITVPEAGGSTWSIRLRFSTINTVTALQVSNVYAQMVQQGPSPDDEAARRLSIQSSFQERYTLEIPLEFYKDNNIEIGRLVILQDARYDLQDGKVFLVIGADPVDAEYKVSLDVWRAEEINVAN